MSHTYPLNPTAYGGTLLNTRKGRSRPRPLSTGQTMHFILRTSQAAGPKPLRRGNNKARITAILKKFEEKHRVKIRDFAINLNHLHLHVRFPSHVGYRRFIRAVSAAIAMAVTGASRWAPAKFRFWETRPYSRVVIGQRDLAGVDAYVRINKLEAIGFKRAEARFYEAWVRGLRNQTG